MCWAAALMAASAAMTVAGGIQSSNAAKANANAINEQNRATSAAQNLAFGQRMSATQSQTAAQAATAQQEANARNQAALTMRRNQQAALDQTNQVLDAENRGAENLRQTGDTAAQTLLDATSGQNLANAQSQAQTQAAQLLRDSQSGAALGPQVTDPNASGSTSTTSTGDAVTDQAIARRTALAATNVRRYGADIAKVASYGQPLQTIGQAVSANNYGIMPAGAADQLLRGGANVRLAPSILAYNQAGATGQTADQLAVQRAQDQNNVSALGFNNASNLADLGQADADTTAKNTAAQAQANAAYQAQLSSLISGLGSLAGYGAGMASGGFGATVPKLPA